MHAFEPTSQDKCEQAWRWPMKVLAAGGTRTVCETVILPEMIGRCHLQNWTLVS
jgi:hypothetical protein